MKRAYSVFNIKSVEETTKGVTIEGVATTPSTDRYGDVVVPEGAEFDLPIPLLWQHEHDKPVGLVEEVTVTSAGIKVRATLAQVEEEGTLKQRVAEAAQSLVAGLVKGFSIGFRPIEWERLKNGEGIKFTKWDWMELSLVTIPANAEATLSVVKKYDEEFLARSFSGQYKQDVAGDSAVSKNIKRTAKTGSNFGQTKEDTNMTLQEQLKALREKKAAHAKRMQEMLTKSGEDLATLDEKDAGEFDSLQKEVEDFDAQIKRIEALERISVQAASVVEKSHGEKASTGNVRVGAVYKDKEDKGLTFARAVRCQILGKGSYNESVSIAERLYGDDTRVANIVKAAVAAGNTSDAGWVGNLVAEEAAAVAAFNEYLRPQTIIGQFGTNGIPALSPIGFRVPIINQTSGASGFWVGEGQAKPLTKATFARTRLEPKKVANIAVLTKEAIRDSNPQADVLVREELIRALRERLDQDFIDPTITVTDERPASITNGVTPIVSSGSSADAVRLDIQRLLGRYLAAYNPPSSAVLIVGSVVALALTMLKNPLGQAEFPDMKLNGGLIAGIPVLVSDYVPADSSGSIVVLVNANDIYFAEGGIEVDSSNSASLEMSDAPVSDSTTPTGSTSLVSMFQTNSIAFLAEKTVNWMRKPGRVAVAYLTGVQWGLDGLSV